MSACFVHRVRTFLLHAENRDISSQLSISNLIVSGSQTSPGSLCSSKRDGRSGFPMQEGIQC
jgi:hypothetical protein